MPSTRTLFDARDQIVTDLEGRRYTLARLIGQGGQGNVFEVKEGAGRLAVKLLHSANETERERLQRRIQAVKRLDLDGLPIAAPIAVLRPPHVGYFMHLAAGMSSLRALTNPPADGRSVSQWYVATGGLRSRLRRLRTVVDIFGRLHARGLVYGDPSPANVLFAADGDVFRAFLIDADNLHVQGDAAACGVFTPGYGAPELICSDSGPNTLTDAFALAVMAFEMLTLVHPFVGDLVHDGEPELEEAAFRGEVPWIEHSTEGINRSSRGIDRKIVVSPEGKKLFQRMFEDGLKDPIARPGLGEWARLFGQAADVTVVCPRCRASYYALKASECSWCGHARPNLHVATLHLWDPDITPASGTMKGGFVTTPSGTRRPLATLILAPKEPVQILGRHVHSDASPDVSEHPLVEATVTGPGAVQVRNLTKQPFLLVKHSEKNRTVPLAATGEAPLPLSSKDAPWYLHFGSLDSLHRAVVFKPLA